jgi:hypothetical protein
VRAFGLEAFLLGRFRAANLGAARAQAARALGGAPDAAGQALGFAALALLLLFLTRSVQGGGMSLGEVGAFITLLALLSTPAQLCRAGTPICKVPGRRRSASELRDLQSRRNHPPLCPPPRLPVLTLTDLTFKRRLKRCWTSHTHDSRRLWSPSRAKRRG